MYQHAIDNNDKKKYDKSNAWGLSTMVNLHKCNCFSIRDPEKIKEFVIKLCDYIEMKRFGDPQVIHFGEDPKVSGYSMTQLIETSLVSAHFVERTNNAYIDIFSCKFYPPFDTANFCKEFFEASYFSSTREFRV